MGVDAQMSDVDRLPRDPSAELLRGFLESHDAPCPVCGYNLRGVTLESCPECSAPIELGVASAQSYLGAWLLALLAFAMPLSFDLLIGVLMIVSSVMTAGEDASALFLMISLVSLSLVSIGMLWVLVARKRDWLRMARRKQWKIAWAIFGGVFLVHLAVGGGFVLIAQ